MFEEVKRNFGFGCMRLPMIGEEVDLEEVNRMVDAFIDAGFNLSEISTKSDYASRIISKWRSARSKNKNNIHFPQKRIKEKQSAYQKMAARLEYLEAENEFLKKLQLLIQSQK